MDGAEPAHRGAEPAVSQTAWHFKSKAGSLRESAKCRTSRPPVLAALAVRRGVAALGAAELLLHAQFDHRGDMLRVKNACTCKRSAMRLVLLRWLHGLEPYSTTQQYTHLEPLAVKGLCVISYSQRRGLSPQAFLLVEAHRKDTHSLRMQPSEAATKPPPGAPRAAPRKRPPIPIVPA